MKRIIEFLIAVVVLMSSVIAKDCSKSKEFTMNHGRRLSGVFLDPNGVELPGIGVQLLSGGRVFRDISTNSVGAYDFGDVPAGKYRIRVRWGQHSFCAPRILCNSNECRIEQRLKVDATNAVTVQ